MAEISASSWSETDASNNAAPPAAWATGMMPNNVEPTARAMMGAIKRFWDRINGVVTTTGSAGAYVYTPANTSYPTAYVQGETYVAKANFTSAGGDTLNVNGLGAKPLYKASAGGPIAVEAGDIQSGQIFSCCYDAALNSGGGGFQVDMGLPSIAGPTSSTDGNIPVFNGTTGDKLKDSGVSPSTVGLPSGTKMLFMQASAPTGWTQVTAVNDAMLRIVSGGTGGSTGGSWTLSGVSLGATALSQSQLPNVSFPVTDGGHSHGTTDPGHYHYLQFGSDNQNFTAGSSQSGIQGAPNFPTGSATTGISINSATTGITVSSGGSGATHTHTWSNDGTWRPAYQDAIVASKN